MVHFRQVNVHLKDNDGMTALMYAVSKDNIDTVKLLLDRGAELKIININGNTALSIVENEEYKHIIRNHKVLQQKLWTESL